MIRKTFPFPALFAAAVLLARASGVFAENAPVTTLDSNFTSLSVAQNAEYLEDRTCGLTLEEALSNGGWNAAGKDRINFGYTASVYWFRFTVENVSAGSSGCLLEVGYPLDEVELFIPDDRGTYRPKKAGFLFPIGLRDVKHRTILFSISPPPGKPVTYYLRVKTTTSMNVPLSIWNRAAFYSFDHEESLLTGIFFGLIGIMIVYNFIFFVFLNDVTYLYYVLSIGGYFLYLLNLKGLDFEYIIGGNPYPFRNLSPVMGAFAMFWTIRFEQKFLKTKETTPFLHQALNVMLGVEAALFVSALLIRSRVFGIAGNVVTIVWIASILTTAVFAWIKRSKEAPYMLIAHTTTFIGVLLFSLRSLGFLPNCSIINYSHQIGFSISSVLLSVGMTSSINRIRREKEAAQAESYEYLKKVNDMQDKFVVYLEAKVEERTQELNEAYDNLKHKESAIERDIQVAKRIQNSLLPGEEDGGVDWSKYFVKYLPMFEVGGDLYDVVKLDSGIVRIFLADATGHGIQAALLTMLIKSTYESVKLFYREPHEILYQMNETFITNYAHLDFFFTGIVADIDFKRSTVRYVSAGHPAQFLIGRDGVREIPHSGKLIGIVPNVNFVTQEIEFRDGDTLLLFTDGLFEEFNANGDELGIARIREWAAESRKKKPADIVESLVRRALDFVGEAERNDDITVMGVKLKSI